MCDALLCCKKIVMRVLLVRVDANSQIGMGHFMRCLALAQAWQDSGGEALFAMATKTSASEDRLRSERIEVCYLPVIVGSREDARQTIFLAKEKGASWVVTDGYQFEDQYQKDIKDAGVHLLFLDDYGHAKHYDADIVLNQNLYAKETIYRHREASSRLLLGASYTLLRRDFLKWKDWRRPAPKVIYKILVTLGGADENNVTLKVIEALHKLPGRDFEAIVVVGPANSHYEVLELAARGSPTSVKFERNTNKMPELMSWADLMVSASGTTCWESVFMQLPSLVIILAENQCAIAEWLASRGLAINLGWHEKLSSAVIAQSILRLREDLKTKAIFQNGTRVIDGKGGCRVVRALLNGL